MRTPPAALAVSLSDLLIAGLALVAALPASAAGTPDPARTPSARAAPMVCVIAPRVEASPADPLGRGVVMERPTLVVADALREVIIETAGRPPWRLRSPGGVLPPVLPWPGAPLAPAEKVTVRLRPEASPPGQGATLKLVAASAQVLAHYRLEKRGLGQRPAAWLLAIEAHLDRGDPERAWALLFDQEAPESASLEALRRRVIQQGCGDSWRQD